MGEMISTLGPKGVRVPDGCATTSEAFKLFLSGGGLDKKVYALLDKLDVEDTRALRATGETIRGAQPLRVWDANFFLTWCTGWIVDASLPTDFQEEIKEAYRTMCAEEISKMRMAGLRVDDNHEVTVAIRSSATAEDLPDASFAGQQETCAHLFRRVSTGLPDTLAQT